MTNDETTRPAAVTGPTSPKQAGDIHTRWGWVEHSVWTERMLTRLAQKRADNRMVWTLGQSDLRAQLTGGLLGGLAQRGSPRSGSPKRWAVCRAGTAELAKLREELRDKRYHRQPARRVWLPKPGTTEKRPLGIPAVRDRTVEAALKQVLEPIFEHDFAEQSYGFRPGRGCREAVKRVEELLSQGHGWCVELDFKSYFDTIPHERLLGLIGQRVVDGSVLTLLTQSLKAGVLEEMKGWEPTEAGTPQGAVISPLLANLYLNALDHEMVKRGWEMVRYADDLVVLCRTREEAEEAMAYLRDWSGRAGLTVHPTKTRIVQVQSEGFDFLGWHFRGHQKWPRKKSLQKLQDKLRPLTRRTRGWSLGAIVAKANPILRGWHGYFRESHRTGLNGPDGWLRRRLRAMLRKREKRPGYGLSEADSRRWPNRWFAAQGLFSLEHGSCAYG